jgi:hypothetical protein
MYFECIVYRVQFLVWMCTHQTRAVVQKRVSMRTRVDGLFQVETSLKEGRTDDWIGICACSVGLFQTR